MMELIRFVGFAEFVAVHWSISVAVDLLFTRIKSVERREGTFWFWFFFFEKLFKSSHSDAFRKLRVTILLDATTHLLIPFLFYLMKFTCQTGFDEHC